MAAYLDTALFGVTITIIIYSLSLLINKKVNIAILNPIILSIIAIIIFLNLNNIDYKVYNKGGSIISFFLGPATVALAVPLYKQINLLRENFLAILLGIVAGAGAGIITVILLSRIFALDKVITLSMLPKSTTSAIAIDIAESIGGNPALAIAFVIATGILGNIIGPALLRICKINNRLAQGISLGTASHVVGTARAMEIGEVEGAMASLAIGVAGLITVFLAPIILSIMN